MSKKTNYVTRKIVEETTYKVYEVDGTKLKPLGTEIKKGKVSQAEMCDKYNVEKVYIEAVGTKKKTYGVPIEKFMAIAVELDEDGKPLTENK